MKKMKMPKFSKKQSNPGLQPEARESKKKKYPKPGQSRLTARAVKGQTMQSPYGIGTDMKQSHNY